MAKEWGSWMKFSAVEVLSLEQVEQLPGGGSRKSAKRNTNKIRFTYGITPGFNLVCSVAVMKRWEV